MATREESIRPLERIDGTCFRVSEMMSAIGHRPSAAQGGGRLQGEGMGAWGYGVFDNDTACDWTYELESCRDLSVVDGALEKILSRGPELVDSSDAKEALAAAEVIARLRGHWGVSNSYTETADTWVKRMSRLGPAEELAKKAVLAIDRILAEPSEILEAWSDSRLLEKWRDGILELRARLEATPVESAVPAQAGAKPWWRFW